MIEITVGRLLFLILSALFVGAMIGLFAGALCNVAAEADRRNGTQEGQHG